MKNRVTLQHSILHESCSIEESLHIAATLLSTVLIKSGGKIRRLKHEILDENRIKHVFDWSGCEFFVITTISGPEIEFTGEAPSCALFTFGWMGKNLRELKVIKAKKIIQAQIPTEVLAPDGILQLVA